MHLLSLFNVFGSLQYKKTYMENETAFKNTYDQQSSTSRKHAYIILTPLNPTIYTVKLGFTGVNIIFFLFMIKNIYCGYSLEPPHRGGSNEYTQYMFWADI